MLNYDYIIVGAGASGLALAYRMASDSFFDNKSILILDKEKKSKNDKTWCFWEQENKEWNAILNKSWDKIIFKSENVNLKEPIYPYEYKMIRSASFYKHIWKVLENKNNFTFENSSVDKIIQKDNFAEVITSEKAYTSKAVFNSVYLNREDLNQTKYPLLQQHFIGYFIKAEAPVFDDSSATFMDFSVDQKGNTRFMYALPYSKTEALFEYTLFSKNLLNEQEYKDAIVNYLEENNIKNYKITEIEKGSIPMTCYPFWKQNSQNVLNIGTAGGWTKASTGFTFKNIQKNTNKLITYLKKEKSLKTYYKKNRFWFYDLLLLDILAEKNHLGAHIFSSMFKNISPQKILKFLDEETTFFEEIYIFLKMHKRLFLKALLKRVF
ncbi:MAG: NAD(P)-binding protein [Flavobacteriaceae bacterium]|nr:NAD(P)-binding protein [Flavobacteriaceae bacterium]